LYARALARTTPFVDRRSALLFCVNVYLLVSIFFIVLIIIIFIIIFFVVLFSDVLCSDHAHLEETHAHQHAAVLLVLC
jgi:uncharacterized membrane protein